MSDIFDGDPKIYIDENGSFLNFVGGQPVMDSGLENAAVISFHTRQGWSGNSLFPNKINKVGSDVEETADKSITRQSILDLIDAAENSVSWMVENNIASKIVIDINNPNSNRVNMTALISQPGRDANAILLTKNGLNWMQQASK